MSVDATPATSEDRDTLLVIQRRLNVVLTSTARHGMPGPLIAFALIDAPHLLDIADRGVQARIQLAALDGIAIRADIVRGLHCAGDRGAGLIVCEHCSAYRHRPLLWPCPTLQALDGLTAP